MPTAYATSDKGRARELNEDYYFISKPDDEVQLFILADGMGGYEGGEIASKLAVNTAKNYILSNYVKSLENKESLLDLVKGASQYANMVVYEKAQSDERLKKMGTTLDICLFYHTNIFISHIGDSRIYRKRKEFFRRMTRDHSYVQKLIDDGKITKEEGINHPDKNMLMKALGSNSYVEPDAMIKGFIKDDVVLMCSDGLTNMVPEQEILSIINENPGDSTKLLIDKANENGGKDNVTAIIIR